jgi:seryl-tRNA synthetase
MKRNLNKSVMSKIAGITKDKVELKSEVVEVNKIKEYSSSIDKFSQENKEVVDIINELSKFKSKFKALDKKIAADFKKIDKEGDSLFGKLSDLGADKEATKVFKDKNRLATAYGANWDMTAVKFLRG